MSNKKYFILLSFIFLFSCKKNSETYTSQTSLPNPEIQNLQVLFATALEEGNLKSAENYALQQKRIAELDNSSVALAVVYENLGKIAHKQEKSTLALENYLKAFALLEGKKENQKAKLAMRIGKSYYTKYQYQKAEMYYLKAKAIFEKEGNTSLENLALTYRNLGLTYGKLQNWQQSINYYEQSTKLLTNLNLEKDLILIYQDIFNAYVNTKDYPKALIYAKKGLELNQKYPDEVKLARTYSNIGIIYQLKKDFSLAKNWFEKTLSLKIENEEVLVITYNNLGYVYLQEKNYALSEDYLLKAEILAQEADLKEDLVETYEYLSELYATKGDANKTLGYYKKYTAIKEELNQSEKLSFTQGINETLKAETQASNFLATHTPSSNDLPYYIGLGFIFMLIFLWGKNMIASKKKLQTELTFIQEQTYQSTLQFKALETGNQDKYINLQQENERLVQAQAKMKEALVSLEKANQQYLELQAINVEKIKESEEFKELYHAFELLKQLYENTHFVISLQKEKNAAIIKSLTEAEKTLKKYEVDNPYLKFLN